MSILFSKMKAHKHRDEYANLLILKQHLMEDRIRNPSNDNVTNSLLQVNSQLDKIAQTNIEFAVFHSRVHWFEYGEKSSKAFFAIEKHNYSGKNMKMIISDCGKHIYDQKCILEEQTKFDKGLYTKKDGISFNLEWGPSEPYLSEEQKEKCDQPIIKAEIYDAIVTLKKVNVQVVMDFQMNFIITFITN